MHVFLFGRWSRKHKWWIKESDTKKEKGPITLPSESKCSITLDTLWSLIRIFQSWLRTHPGFRGWGIYPLTWLKILSGTIILSYSSAMQEVNILNWIQLGSGDSQVVLVIKNLPNNAGDVRDTGSISELGRCPGGGHGEPLQYSCLENPMDRGAW